MTPTSNVIKTDRLGRMTLSRAHRESLLDAFADSAMSGQAFARSHGIKYTTFANWVQKRHRVETPSSDAGSEVPRLSLAEITLEAQAPLPTEIPLTLTLPSGIRIELADPVQLPLLVEVPKNPQDKPQKDC